MATTKNAFDIGNAATFLEEIKKLIADEEKQWLVVGNYLTDPQVPRSALRPASGTPKVGDIMYGAGLDGLFLCAEITGVSTTGGATVYDYTYLN